MIFFFENWELRIEAWVSIFEDEESSFLSFEALKEFFEALEQRFWGNNSILKK